MKLWITLIVSVLLLCSCSKHPVRQSLHTKDGYEIRIIGESSWEYSESYYYEVWKDDEKIIAITFLGTDDVNKYYIRDSDDGGQIYIFSRSSDEIISRVER